MRLQKCHETGETSSAGNLLMKRHKLKRKRSDSSNCHQCHRNDRETVIACTNCKSKKYCITCITKWYTRLEEKDVAEACPVCRNICNCAVCLKSNMINEDSLNPEFSTTDKIQHSKYIIKVLLPFLKQFIAEENIEREAEARSHGTPIPGLQLLRSNFTHADQMQCNNCKASIFNLHRSCLNCSYKLCISCCQEIRGVFVTKEGSSGAAPYIVCPPLTMGGCGRWFLELRSSYPANWISELLRKAEAIAEASREPNPFEASEKACTCLPPTTLNIEKNDKKHFHWHLYKGEPAIVPNVLNGIPGLSWEPLVMWRACRKARSADNSSTLDFRVLNSSNGLEETINMHQFFSGYVEGLFDSEGRLKSLKLEDWPPAESFEERLPRHFWEFIRCLPFRHYTHPHSRYLNMPAIVHDISLEPDLEPKICICYGGSPELGFGSVTRIQYAQSDRVNILMHTAAICLGPQRMEYENKGMKKYDPSISRGMIENTEHGAIWDIFRRDDVPKLEEYLRKHAMEFTYISLMQQLVHPVHEKVFYLTVEQKENLKEEYGIEPWTFVQKLGDAVFVPAGCPHQIRYLKSCTSVALDFVSPESVGECIRLSSEYRCLPQNHRCKEDKLQVKKRTLHAVSQAVQYLDMVTLSNTSRNQGIPPLICTHKDKNGALAFVKVEMEAKKSMLEEQGHLMPPHMRAHLQREVREFLNKIGSIIGSSSSQ